MKLSLEQVLAMCAIQGHDMADYYEIRESLGRADVAFACRNCDANLLCNGNIYVAFAPVTPCPYLPKLHLDAANKAHDQFVDLQQELAHAVHHE